MKRFSMSHVIKEIENKNLKHILTVKIRENAYFNSLVMI